MYVDLDEDEFNKISSNSLKYIINNSKYKVNNSGYRKIFNEVGKE